MRLAAVVIASIVTMLVAPLPAEASSGRCVKDGLGDVIYGPVDRELDPILDPNGDLTRIRKRTPEKTDELNANMLRELEAHPAPEVRGDKRKAHLSKAEADALFADVKANRQVSESLCGRYKKSARLGFCWGRATAAHLKGIQHGLHKDSVRKVWAVGDLRRGDTQWHYHVTTIVRGEGGKWYAIDPIFKEAMTVEDWYAGMKSSFDPDGTMRIHSTKANRFWPVLDRGYRRADFFMPANDGFFIDLLGTIEQEFRRDPGKWKTLATEKDRKAFVRNLLIGAGITVGTATYAAFAYDFLFGD